jgi:GntR family transcriptional regulator, transcriptional repressor for pyruvate dehydrogenase complex
VAGAGEIALTSWEDAVAEPSRRPAARGRRPEPVELPRTGRLAVTRLSDDLAERIRRLIISEDIAEGARLPPERDLAERFGASRPTVSQALRALSLMGLVEIRRGSGAYVVRRPETMVTASVNLMLDLDQRSLSDLMQLRLWLETLGAREAAARRPGLPPGEAAAIGEALGRLGDSARDASEVIAADTVFHATVVRTAGNLYLAAIYESVHTAALSFEYRHWVDTESVPDWLRDTSPEQHLALHEPIAAAVLQGDPDAAARAVAAHHQVMLWHILRA